MNDEHTYGIHRDRLADDAARRLGLPFLFVDKIFRSAPITACALICAGIAYLVFRWGAVLDPWESPLLEWTVFGLFSIMCASLLYLGWIRPPFVVVNAEGVGRFGDVPSTWFFWGGITGIRYETREFFVPSTDMISYTLYMNLMLDTTRGTYRLAGRSRNFFPRWSWSSLRPDAEWFARIRLDTDGLKEVIERVLAYYEGQEGSPCGRSNEEGSGAVT